MKGRIDLPPPEPLPYAALPSMMVVAPSLAHRKERQQPIVSGIIAGYVASASVNEREMQKIRQAGYSKRTRRLNRAARRRESREGRGQAPACRPYSHRA